MNNKAFTVVELLTSFTLTMIIVVFLFEIVIELKDVYVADSIKTKILNQNALVATGLNKTLSEINFISEVECTDNGCTVTGYKKDGTQITQNISINNDNTVNISSNQKISLPSKTSIKDKNIYEDTIITNPLNNSSLKDNAYIKVSYVVTSDYLKKDIKFNYIYSYYKNQ